MRVLLSILTLFSLEAFAGFEKLTIQNLDFEYAAPYGKGTVEKVGIGVGFIPEAFEIEMTRTDNALELTSPYMDFTWYRPLKFIYDLEKISSKKTSASLGTKTHFVESEFFMVQPKKQGVYKAEKMKASCEGSALGSFEVRLLEDCRTKMDMTIKKVDVPTDFILLRVLEELPKLPSTEMDIPADNFIFSSRNGVFSLQVYVKYWFYAGLRAWGQINYENDHKTIAIKVDQIKFGYLNVTNMVMKKLQEINTNPDVKVDPPWIKINIERLHETQSR